MTRKIITMFTMVYSLNLMADSTPIAPINAGAYNFTGTSARLSFKDLANNETGFRVYHQGDELAQVSAKEGVGKYQYINVYNLTPCTLYTVGIVAYNNNGESNPLVKSFRTKDCDLLPPTNQAPTANAGEDKSVVVGNSITIIGSGLDADGTISSYVWKKGIEVLGTTANLTYTPTTVGTEILTLTVTDNDGATASDSMKLLISEDTPPLPPASSLPLTPINLAAYNFSDTSARLSFLDMADNEDGFRVYHNGVEIAQVGAKAGTGTYQYVNVLNLEICQLYTIQLVAFNSQGESSPITKSFRTIGCASLEPTNKPPIVNAGVNKTLLLGDTIDIVGSASDSDGSISSYVWKRGSTVLSNTATLYYEATVKGVDTLTFTATDNEGTSASDTLRIFVNDPNDLQDESVPVDITLFGAIPDDGIDDTEAISEALMVSGSITMPTGIYNVKDLVRFGKTVIDGNGSTFKTEKSPVVSTSSNILTLKTELDSDKIWIKNLILDGDCPTESPTKGDYVHSLIHIYDSKNIVLDGMLVKDYTSQFRDYNKSRGDLVEHAKMNLYHDLDMHYTIFIAFSRDITIRNMKQVNIKHEGPLVYESDNILIENFRSSGSDSIWSALHVVASDNISMKHINVTDGLINTIGSSVNFFANHYFTLFDVNTTNKQGFDISNEVDIEKIATGRIRRDTSYGTFTNCRFEGYHPVQAYPTKDIHESLSFFNTKFIPSRVEGGANAIRFQKAGELLFDHCTLGSETIMTEFPMILGNTRKLTVSNSTFLNTNIDPSVDTGSIYFYGAEFGDLNITNSSFTGIDYTPVVFRKLEIPRYANSNGRVHEFRFLNNTITDENELKTGEIYKIFNFFILDNIVMD